jgi:hypothetical protein
MCESSKMDQVQKLFEAAIAAEEAGNSVKALRLYKQVSAIDPDAPYVATAMGVVAAY